MGFQWPDQSPLPAGVVEAVTPGTAGLNSELVKAVLRRLQPAQHLLTGRVDLTTTPQQVAPSRDNRLGFAVSVDGGVSNVWLGDSELTALNALSNTQASQGGTPGFWLPASGASGGFIWVFSRDDDYRGPIWMTASTGTVWISFMELLP